jgi:hypothetical protein
VQRDNRHFFKLHIAYRVAVEQRGDDDKTSSLYSFNQPFICAINYRRYMSVDANYVIYGM